MQMRSGAISLRAPEPSDLGIMYLFENNMEVWLYSETSRPYSSYTIAEYIKTAHDDIYATKQLRLVIDLSDADGFKKVIGFIDIYDFDPTHRRAGVGILIGDEEERKKGYASIALQLVIQYAFQVLNLHQLYCLIEQANDHSIRLFTHAGFKDAGLLKDWLLTEGKWQHVMMMQLVSGIG